MIDLHPEDGALTQSAAWLWRWLAEEALPLWWRAGADHVGGGFFESLGADGVAPPLPGGAGFNPGKSMRSPSAAKRAGGPAAAVVDHGLGYFLEKYRRPDGLFRACVEADGRVRDDHAFLYDQAFALLGLLGAHQLKPHARLQDAAENLLNRILQYYRHSAGGFREDDAAPFQSNAQMHLFEACLAWAPVAGGAFTDTADEIGALCLDRLIDPKHGVIDEYYDADWRPGGPNGERRIEPGHQFEWAWLLSEWSRTGGRSVAAPVERLFQVGEASVLSSIDAAPAAVSTDGALRDPVARLWPQTERMRAAALLSRTATNDRPFYARAAARAADCVKTYLDTPIGGLWRDKRSPDGGFMEEPAPASSLYHLAGAIVALKGIVADPALAKHGHPVTERPNLGPVAGSAGAGRKIAFDHNGRPFTLTMPLPGDSSIASVFLVGLPKAGSTLLNKLMRPITMDAGLSFVSLQDTMFNMGVAPQHIPATVNAGFAPSGFAFGGFRSLPGGFELPSYANGRTLLLVRDPRDMLTSLYFSLARSHASPGKTVGEEMAATFEERRRQTNSMGIDAFALAKAAVVIDQYATVAAKLSTISYQLYRYEDIIFDKLSWAHDMVAYLNLTVSSAVLESAVNVNDVRPDVEHPALHVRKVVPGDHREKLRVETITKLNTRLEPILRRYRYL